MSSTGNTAIGIRAGSRREKARTAAGRTRYTLYAPGGSYHADTLVRLLLELLAHRLRHLLRGDGWRD